MGIEITDSNFQKEVIEKSKEKYVLVDFWAPWCMPCLMLAPHLEQVVKEYGDKLIFGKFNVDENTVKPKEYSIMSIPAVKLFKDGKEIDSFVGSLPLDSIKQFLDKHIK